jgi:peptidoglycan/xylan/chitin deacetylase (PgdA/CDA1 family)
MDTTRSDEPEPSLLTPARVILFTSFFLLTCTKISKQMKVPIVYSKKDPVVKTEAVKPVAIKKKKKKIYLTFDDGPNKGTQNVLNIIKEEQVPVTFFVVGEHVYASTSQQKTWDSLSATENIEICSHSYTHAWHNKFNQFYNNPDSMVKDFKRAQDSLKLDNNVVRTPGRNTWRIDSLHYTDLKASKAAVDSLQKAGFVVLGWDLEWHYDPKTLTVKNTADELINNVDSVFNNKKTKNPDNLVLLAHDQVYNKSADSLQLHDFIKKLKAKDEYELSLVSGYPGIVKTDTLKIKTIPVQ